MADPFTPVTPRLRFECRPLGPTLMMRFFSDNTNESSLLLATPEQARQVMREIEDALIAMADHKRERAGLNRKTRRARRAEQLRQA